MEMIKLGLLKNKYKLERKIAQGGMSSIYLCTNTELGNKWIAKHIHKSYSGILYEEEILKKLNHINLPRIIDVCHEDSGMYIIESYIEGVSLQKKLEDMGALSLDKVVDYTLQLCEVMIYLHNIKPKPIIHRDIKPSNIIITEYDKLVLIDFGISEEQGGVRAGLKAGTNAYAAPEQLVDSTGVDMKADIYSMGIVLHQMLTGQLAGRSSLAYESNSHAATYGKLLDISEKCSRFLPRERYQKVEDLKEELQQLEHKYISIMENRKAKMKLALMLLIVSSIINYFCLVMGLMLH